MLFGLIAVSLFVSANTAVPKKRDPEVHSRELLLAIHNDVQRIKNQTLGLASLLRSGCIECFDGLGCFDGCNGTFKHISGPPQDPSELKTRFIIYSRRNRDKGLSFDYFNFKPDKSFLDAPRKLVFLVHGFSSDSNADWVVNIRRGILEIEDALVITVDWSQGAVLPYYAQAVVNSELVGRQIAVVLHKLWRFSPKNVSPQRTHYIGHSLGAQMAMFFSRYFRELSGNVLIGRITALDPAAPLLEAYNVCLNRSDAIFIDGIHTSAGDDILAGKLGVRREVGHLDLYVNGGSQQPGCGAIEYHCSHRRAHIYYTEALRLPPMCSFQSYACMGGMKEYEAGQCRRVPDQINGISYDKSQSMPGRGMHFVNTRGSPPFCIALHRDL